MPNGTPIPKNAGLNRDILRVDYAKRRLNDLTEQGVAKEKAWEIIGSELRAGAATKVTGPIARGAKVHAHSEQFDGRAHPTCGQGVVAVSPEVFSAVDPKVRCTHCARDEFPNGQPGWHAAQAKNNLAPVEQLVEEIAGEVDVEEDSGDRPRP